MSGLPDDVYGELDGLLAGADEALTAGWPGDPATRQPVQLAIDVVRQTAHDVAVQRSRSAVRPRSVGVPQSRSRAMPPSG